MAAIAIIEPAIYLAATEKEPDVGQYPFSGTTIVRGDFVTLAAGTVTKGTSNAATTWAGMARHGSLDVYFSGIGGAAAITDSALFGSSTATTSLMANEPGNLHIDLFHNNQPIEISLVQSWALATLGAAAAGVGIDGTSGKFVADTSLGNKVLNIIGTVDGPTRGTVGDTGKRVLVTFTAASLAI